MFLGILMDILIDILLLVLTISIIIAVGSVFFIRDLRKDFKQVFKIRSKFHIEIRKIVNLIYNVYNSDLLEPFTKVVIKNLPHEQKKILLKNIDAVYSQIDIENPDNKYIVETYENLQKLRRERDARILVYNYKLNMFPYSLYGRMMKLPKYELYTENE